VAIGSGVPGHRDAGLKGGPGLRLVRQSAECTLQSRNIVVYAARFDMKSEKKGRALKERKLGANFGHSRTFLVESAPSLSVYARVLRSKGLSFGRSPLEQPW